MILQPIMLKRLQTKWGVNTTQFIIIMCVFAITGTTTAWITKVITEWVGFTSDTYWLWRWMLRLAMLIFGYQVILLSVAFLFGQFPFFWQYEKKILKRMGIPIPGEVKISETKLPIAKTHDSINVHEITAGSDLRATDAQEPVYIALFASGAGSNARAIIDYFRKRPFVKVALIISNKPQAGVLDIATKENIPTITIAKERFFKGDSYIPDLKSGKIQWIILAGFLWKVPAALIEAFPGKIINIHPALLPNYGGKGMYGHFVHEAVIAAGEQKSGITIHYVDELFDHGAHIFQAYCDIEPGETPEMLAKKIQVLEHRHYPEVIERLIKNEGM